MCYNYIYKKQGAKKPISEMGRGGLRSYKKIKRKGVKGSNPSIFWLAGIGLVAV